MNKRTLTGEAPRKRGKKKRQGKTGKRAGTRAQPKATRDHTSAIPTSAVISMQPTPDQIAGMQAEEFERARRKQIARAAVELDEVDGRILEYKLRHPTITQQEIGDLIGLGREAVNARMNAAKFKRAIAIANETALTIYQGNQAAAARKLGALIHSADDRVAVRACMAHMWPHIHAGKDGGGGENEFVKMITEAWNQSEAI